MKLSSMAFQPKAAKRAIVMLVVQKVLNATNKGNVHVMTMSKEEPVTVVKKTNTTDIKDAWTARLATTSFKTQLMNIARSCQLSTKF